MNSITFSDAFEALTGHRPFPWQEKMYNEHLVKGNPPPCCNLPTGLGKTAIMPIWLIALATMGNNKTVAGERLPRRLVYVVNRRTVVDQATREAENLRKKLEKPESPVLQELARRLRQLAGSVDGNGEALPLAISTLRGEFADNGEWSADPSRPAIIVGTVDMIGSRLLFSGYGCGFKRPLHAGFLGQDVLLVHDEAHLEPAFQKLLVTIEDEQQKERERTETRHWPKLRVMELTATSRTEKESQEGPFTLTPDDQDHAVVKKRINAHKTVRLHENTDEKNLADEIAQIALGYQDLGSELAVLLFVRTVEDVEKIARKLPEGSVERLTGTLRGKERDALVKKPVFQRFLPESNRDPNVTPQPGTVYLVCTSAGEVGIDISADHMVCDLSTFDSMAQRFGRVNRFGDRDDSEIHIVHPASFGKKGNVNKLDERRQRTLQLLKLLNGDGSPAAIDRLDATARQDAFAPKPEILPATDILFDAWSLTTIRDKLPGRPPVEPYLHGIEDDKRAETRIAWREEVSELDELSDQKDRDELQELATEILDDYPLKPHELLRDSTDRPKSGMLATLKDLAKRDGDLPVWVQGSYDPVIVTTLSKVVDLMLADRTVILPPEAGGLGISRDSGVSEGVFDGSEYAQAWRFLYDVADEWKDDKGPLRKRIWLGEDKGETKGMVLERKLEFGDPEDEDAAPQKTRLWFVRKPELPDEHSLCECLLKAHLTRAEEFAEGFVRGLGLPKELAQAVKLAAASHDLGKDRAEWQRYANNAGYPNEVWAKSPKFRDWRTLGGYRHELGSLMDVLDPEQPYCEKFNKLEPDLQELLLHLIATHHGRARPHFSSDKVFGRDGRPQLASDQAAKVPRRFARLQREYGRWGLAYLESLLRAADWAASAEGNKESP